MSDSITDCCEQTVSLPLNIFVPIRGNDTTSHPDDSPKAIVGFTLPLDDLSQTVMVTVISKNSTGSIRLSTHIQALVTRRSADSPDYTVDIGHQALMNSEDLDIEYDLVANGDAGINLRVTDTSGDFAGDLTHNFQIWILDEIVL